MVIVKQYLHPDNIHLTERKLEEWINKICEEENAYLIAVTREYFIFSKTKTPELTNFEKAIIWESENKE